ncbi:alpha amylase [Anaeramoeba flamelloides]|uniref:Alpha amylase n=1 Tax=Anaeramoeba flamelloides TaxID=1746091 RepID=A0ABQ8XC97_9EUKA|nr:alpha amylase [Anaeramoeba flamelloides]
MIKKSILLFALLFIFQSIPMAKCDHYYPLMMEYSTRPWLYSLSQKYGKTINLGNIPDSEYDALQDQKLDYIWMMGIWKLGAYGLRYDRTNQAELSYFKTLLPDFTIDDVIGSPYAITEYVINPDIGTTQDLINFRKRLNGMGTKLILDFVPNHSAVDSPWNTTNPNYYIHAPKGSVPPYDSSRYLPWGIAYGGEKYDGAWKDTAQLNYWNQDLRNAQTQNLLTIAKYADGIRTDMTQLALNDVIQMDWSNELSSWGYNKPSTEFWCEAISSVKNQYPDLIFLGEQYWGYDDQLINCGFDFLYDKALLDHLASYKMSDIWSYLNSKISYFPKYSHYTENHDEPRAITKFGSWWQADAGALASFTLPGMRFSFEGQWKGFKNKLDVHLRRAKSEDPNQDVVDFYKKFQDILATDVFRKGTWSLINDCSNKNQLITYRWYYKKSDGSYDKRLVVINLSGYQASGNVVVSDAYAQSGDDIVITELLTDKQYTRSASEMRSTGLDVIVNSWYAQIFSY